MGRGSIEPHLHARSHQTPFDMSLSVESTPSPPLSPCMLTTKHKVVHKVVLTGGPCAGKTTTLARLRTFFENLGWRVYCVPETATILLGGGVKFEHLDSMQSFQFQENIVKTMLQIEQTFFDLASREKINCLIVCDRGTMDPSAFCSDEEWQKMLQLNNWNSLMLRDERYDQIIHLETAAKGAEEFYQISNNNTRSEGLELARERDTKAAQAWVGHPYCDVIDNSTDFENKVRRVLEVICKRLGEKLGVDVDDRLKAMSKKRKFLVKSLPPLEDFPSRYQDFEVQHDYLLSVDSQLQPRIRKRGQRGRYTYTRTDRKVINDKKMELLRQITRREYEMLLKQRDPTHHSILKTRRCFHWQGHYFQLDIFKEPCSSQCQDLILLETYTTKTGSNLELPSFLDISKEVTDVSDYSMFNLSILSPSTPPTSNGPVDS